MTTVVEVNGTYWRKIILHYTHVLYEQFLFEHITPLLQYHVQTALHQEMLKMQKRETHPAWHIPLKVEFDLSKNAILIVPVDPTQLRIL